MNQPETHGPTVLCIASFFKGNEFLRESARSNWRVVLLTREKLLDQDWARESLDELIAVPVDGDAESYIEAATHVARHFRVRTVVALEEYDIVTAARVREHLCLPGLGVTSARTFQDKLAMRVKAREARLRQPEFARLFDPREAAEFFARVAPLWMLKPRVGASAMGMKRLDDAEEAWCALANLDGRRGSREQPPQHLVEESGARVVADK